MDTELFFAYEGDARSRAKATCRGCPVQVECRDFAIGASMEYGVWGGTTRNSRLRVGMKPKPHEKDWAVGLKHGTLGAYQRHLAKEEVPCPLCLEGNAQRRARYKGAS